MPFPFTYITTSREHEHEHPVKEPDHEAPEGDGKQQPRMTRSPGAPQKPKESPKASERSAIAGVTGGSGGGHVGENRSRLSSALPLVDHGRWRSSSKDADPRHRCGPQTFSRYDPHVTGEKLSQLSSLYPLTDPHVTRAPLVSKHPHEPEPEADQVFTPMNVHRGIED